MRCAARAKLVVVHDPQLERLAGQRLEVRKTSWNTLRSLDVGSYLDPRFAGARLSLLSEVLEALPAATLVNVELKGQDSMWAVDLGLGAAVARVLRAAAAKERFLVSSFNPALLLAFKRAAPEIATAFLFGDKASGLRGASLGRLLRVQALNPSLCALRGPFVAALEGSGLRHLRLDRRRPRRRHRALPERRRLPDHQSAQEDPGGFWFRLPVAPAPSPESVG